MGVGAIGRMHAKRCRRHEQVRLAAIATPPRPANVMATWLKPDSYFELAWRRQRGGGPDDHLGHSRGAMELGPGRRRQGSTGGRAQCHDANGPESGADAVSRVLNVLRETAQALRNLI